MTDGTRVVAAACGIACSLAVGPITAGQRSTVKDDVHVPGTGMVLKPGWKFLSYTGCGCLVPISWQPSFDEPLALGPDGSSLSIRKETVASWAAYKEQVRRSYGVRVVHEDSERRLWFETGDESRVEHYIAAPSGLTVCVGVLNTHRWSASSGAESVVVIARSIGLLPPNWPAELP